MYYFIFNFIAVAGLSRDFESCEEGLLQKRAIRILSDRPTPRRPLSYLVFQLGQDFDGAWSDCLSTNLNLFN